MFRQKLTKLKLQLMAAFCETRPCSVREIEETQPERSRLSHGRRWLLTTAVVAAVSGPLVIGILGAPQARDGQPPTPSYEVASVRPSKSAGEPQSIGPGPHGGVRAVNVTALRVMCFAYA